MLFDHGRKKVNLTCNTGVSALALMSGQNQGLKEIEGGEARQRALNYSTVVSSHLKELTMKTRSNNHPDKIIL